MTVLITGATGFVGGHLVELLVERGEHIRILARHGEDVSWLRQMGVEVYWGDLTDFPSLQAAVTGVQRVFHCAARTGPWGPQSDYELVNVTGPRLLAEAALAAGVQRIVHVSSITVHGVDIHGTANETAPLRGGTDPYSKTKVAGERALEQLIQEKAAPITIVRPGLIYGPRDTNSFARFARLLAHGQLPIIGSGANLLPLIYVRDVALGILLASQPDCAIGNAYLLVNDEPVTQAAYFDTIASALGVPPPRLHIPYSLAIALAGGVEVAAHLAQRQQPPPLMRFGLRQIGGQNRFLIDRARHDLGFSPQVNLSEGVRLSVAWYRSLAQPSTTQQNPIIPKELAR